MRFILRMLKRVWLFSFLRRIYNATKIFNKKYAQILKWGISSREYTNFTYDLTDRNVLYLAHTISVVLGCNHKTILAFIEEAQNDESLKEHVKRETKNSPFGKYADLDVRFARRLGWYAFTRALKPRVVIESGVDKGIGSVLLCAALLKNREEGFNGRYFGTDINPDAGYLLTGKYKEVGEILYGDSIESLTRITDTIDLFINDSDHSDEYEYQEYLTISSLITDKSIIIGDNSHCTDKLAVFSGLVNRKFLFFKEEPKNHWFPGAGMGISFKDMSLKPF